MNMPGVWADCRCHKESANYSSYHYAFSARRVPTSLFNLSQSVIEYIAICDRLSRAKFSVFSAGWLPPTEAGGYTSGETERPMSSWDAMMRSFGVLRRDKQLVLFPVLSTVAAILVSVPFILAIFIHGVPERWDVSHLIITFAWYCCANFAIIFFNCALAASAQTFFEGGEPSLGQGISAAAGHIPGILAWSMVSTTVGMILRWVDERSGIVGRIVTALIGIGWNMATYLIVPVLVLEDRGVLESIRRSGELLKKTWGEQLIAGITFFWAGLLAAIPGIVIGVIGMNGFWPLIPVAALYFAALAATVSAARQVFNVALYRYATTGEPPEGYSVDALRG